MCTIYVPGAHRNQKRALSSLDLWLQVVMNHHVGSGTEPRSFGTTEPSLEAQFLINGPLPY